MSRAPIISGQLNDIQGMLNSGFGWLTNSRFWLLTIRDGQEERARAWLRALDESNLVVTAEHVRQDKKHVTISEAVAIAFSFAGLAKLGIKETSAHPFPTPFRSGMGSELRQSLLRDIPREQWQWSDVEGYSNRQIVHIVVASWRREGAEEKIPPLDPEVFDVNTIDHRPGTFCGGKLFEPFGFRDGVAQPIIRGLRSEDGDNPKRVREHAGVFYDDRVIAPGEFIVGYPNEYDELTYCPDVQNWKASDPPDCRFTLNGSYLAARQIQQKVGALKALEAANPVSSGPTIGEKMMGRYRNGAPLSSDGTTPVSDSAADAFRFQVDDPNGFICPRGAHIRRMNPRDGLGVDVRSGIKASKLHRLLRRGRPYRREFKSGAYEEGLFFIACNADLERQFEFIHQRWMRNFRFGSLHHEDDPVVGSPVSRKTFTMPGIPVGKEVCFEALTSTLGGGYFFLPGIRALKFIAGIPSA